VIAVTRLAAEFERLDDYWSPRVVGRVNDHYVKVAKLRGEFVWHTHDDEDELFSVVRGRLVIRLEDGEVALEAGDFCVVPAGTAHCPVAAEECWVTLIEPVATTHTGAVASSRTKTIEQQLG